MTEGPVQVLVVDDDHLMRAGLRGVLSNDAAIEVVGEAQDGRDAIYRTRLLRPDVVLMDVRMPDLDGISATRELLAAFPAVKVVILTTFEQDDYIFGALAAGASGFLLKRTSPEELVAAIHTIAAGDSLLSPSVTNRVIERMAAQPVPSAAAGRAPRRAHGAGARGALARRSRPVERRDRCRARHRGVDGQDPHEAHARQAGRTRPRPSGDLRVRVRPDPASMSSLRRGPG